jgi:hypothetical protein
VEAEDKVTISVAGDAGKVIVRAAELKTTWRKRAEETPERHG